MSFCNFNCWTFLSSGGVCPRRNRLWGQFLPFLLAIGWYETQISLSDRNICICHWTGMYTIYRYCAFAHEFGSYWSAWNYWETWEIYASQLPFWGIFSFRSAILISRYYSTNCINIFFIVVYFLLLHIFDELRYIQHSFDQAWAVSSRLSMLGYGVI